MSIFSSSLSKRIEQSTSKVQRLRTDLAEAEAERRDLRAELCRERLSRVKDDTVRPGGASTARFGGVFANAPVYSASDLARQTHAATDSDLSRIEELLDRHEANAR